MFFTAHVLISQTQNWRTENITETAMSETKTGIKIIVNLGLTLWGLEQYCDVK